MEAISAYSLATCAWLGAQAVPMLLTPGFINSMLVEGYQPASSVDIYTLRHLGLAQLALSLLSLALSGVLPLAPAAASADDSISPYADAAVLLTALYHAANAFHSWARWGATGGSAAYGLGFVGSGVLAAFGLWCLMFAGDKGRISKRTGADKRTSGFPFRNVEADKRKARKLTRQPVGCLARKTPLGVLLRGQGPGSNFGPCVGRAQGEESPNELPTAPRGQGTDLSTPVAR
ncbi:hypothetical protein PspLS_04459 [Pyricularia sp. CBS 133598]|nr:hypothetical protein PspLS_04459 [Pyricularia sp. CBS 133598]